MNNAKNNISFFIPAWNCENTIGESIDSIIKTNLTDGDEIVIVNDASTDNTLKIIKNYVKKYNFIKIINHGENKGGAMARNTAIKNSKNEILFCLDSDNILIHNSIEKLKKFMLKNKADAVSFGSLHYFKKKITHKWIFKKGLNTLNDCLSGSISPISSGNYMFTKKSWKNAGGYPEFAKALDAWGFGLRQIATKTKFLVMPNSFYLHRYGHESYWIRGSKKKNEITFQILKSFFYLIEKRDVEYIKNNKNNWFSNLNKHPIKIKGQNYGQNGKIVHIFNYKATIKKIIIYITKRLKLYCTLKKYILHINFKKEFYLFKNLAEKNNRFSISWKEKYPCLNDKTSKTSFDAHYIYHPAWAARILAKIKPKKHIDISSTLHFCSLVSAFIPIEFYDFRPAKLNLNNLISKQANLTSLPFKTNSIKSLSCMHTIEHIGLGRYGDKFDPNGDLKAIKELKRVLAINGNLLFVVPIGKPKIMFNAHRIYSYNQIMEYFNCFELKDFSLITDQGNFIQNSNKNLANMQKYGCGCFWFIKKLCQK